MSVDCYHCGKEIEEISDTTFSNYDSGRCYKGQHTGNIYYCGHCESYTLECLITGDIEPWSYTL